MINKLRNIELEYVRCFSIEKRFENHIEFIDEKFRDTYTSNVSVLNKSIDDDSLIQVVNNEVRLLNNRKKYFLNFEINQKVSSELIKNLIRKPRRIDVFNYLLIESSEFKNINVREQVSVKKAEVKEEYKNLLDIYVKDNEKSLGRSYSIYRIKRKIKAYKDPSNNLSSYICYCKGIPVGYCEVFRKDGICKIEEVGVLEKYRGARLGTHMIRQILEENYNIGIKYTYLISEEKGMAENLYKRLGFQECGKKTQLIW